MARLRITAKQARHATMGVWLLQAAVLLTWFVTSPWNPPRVGLLELLWAGAHKPQFYPLVALLVGGPLLSLVSWQKKGKNRDYLVVGWVVFMVVLMGVFAERAGVMVRVLWWSLTR